MVAVQEKYHCTIFIRKIERNQNIEQKHYYHSTYVEDQQAKAFQAPAQYLKDHSS